MSEQCADVDTGGGRSRRVLCRCKGGRLAESAGDNQVQRSCTKVCEISSLSVEAID